VTEIEDARDGPSCRPARAGGRDRQQRGGDHARIMREARAVVAATSRTRNARHCTRWTTFQEGSTCVRTPSGTPSPSTSARRSDVRRAHGVIRGLREVHLPVELVRQDNRRRRRPTGVQRMQETATRSSGAGGAGGLGGGQAAQTHRRSATGPAQRALPVRLAARSTRSATAPRRSRRVTTNGAAGRRGLSSSQMSAPQPAEPVGQVKARVSA